MRCECCDKELSPAEDSAMFKEANGVKPYRRVGMCGECRSYLPPEVGYVQKRGREVPHLDRDVVEEDPFDLSEYGEDEERW
jgi:hypothetical protein